MSLNIRGSVKQSKTYEFQECSNADTVPFYMITTMYECTVCSFTSADEKVMAAHQAERHANLGGIAILNNEDLGPATTRLWNAFQPNLHNAINQRGLIPGTEEEERLQQTVKLIDCDVRFDGTVVGRSISCLPTGAPIITPQPSSAGLVDVIGRGRQIRRSYLEAAYCINFRRNTERCSRRDKMFDGPGSERDGGCGSYRGNNGRLKSKMSRCEALLQKKRWSTSSKILTRRILKKWKKNQSPCPNGSVIALLREYVDLQKRSKRQDEVLQRLRDENEKLQDDIDDIRFRQNVANCRKL